MDVFQALSLKVEVESEYSMKVLQADSGGEFISVKVWLFCKKRDIVLRYIAPYVYEQNRTAEQIWLTIIIMKDSIFIDSDLPKGFWAETIETVNYL